MAGEYRTEEVLRQLPADIAAAMRAGTLRIALTSQPVLGATKRPDMAPRLADCYAKIGLTKYVDGLRGGGMVAILVPPTDGSGNRVWRPGELFMTS